MLLNVNVLYSDLDDVAGLKEVGGVLNESVGHLGDVEKSVVVNTDVNEAAEVGNVSYSTVKLHIRLKILYRKNLGGEDRSGSVVTDISAGLFKLGDDVVKGGLTAAELTRKLSDAVLLCLKSKEGEVIASYVVGREIKLFKKLVCELI